MSNQPDYETGVIGLGLIGSAVVRYLAAAGATVAGIGPAEPVDWSNHRGAFASHYDSGRITRKLDIQLEWAILAVRSMAQYPILEAASGLTFHRPAGTMFIDPDPQAAAQRAAVGRSVGATFAVDPPSAYRGPKEVTPPSAATVTREPAPAGHIDPRVMGVAQRKVAAGHGAELVEAEVVSIERVPGGFRLGGSNDRSVHVGQVVVAAGAFTAEIHPALAGLALRPRAETVVLAELGADEQARLAGLPAVLAGLEVGRYQDLYLVPPTGYPDGSVQLKLGATLAERAWLATAGERRAWMSGDAHAGDLPALRDLLLGVIPDVAAENWTTKPCLITDTPTRLPFIGEVDDGLFVAAGGNGFAGKSADAIGAVAARLVTEGGRWTDPDLAEAAFRPTFTH